MRNNLWDDPRVGRLCDLCGCVEAPIVGGLYWLWATADQHTEDGILPGLSLRQIDRKSGVPGFGQAMCDIGWLAEEVTGVRILRFEEHNGTSAKKRAVTAKRVANHRSGNADVTQAALQGEHTGVSDALAREREEEEKRSLSLRSRDSAAVQRASRPKREDITLKTYLDRCKAEGVKPLPADHPVRSYCADAGISDEMLQVAWCVFRDDYLSGTNKGKRYKDWPGHFANAVRGCWSKLWYTDAGEVKWSSRGLQEKQVLDNRQRAKEAGNAA